MLVKFFYAFQTNSLRLQQKVFPEYAEPSDLGGKRVIVWKPLFEFYYFEDGGSHGEILTAVRTLPLLLRGADRLRVSSSTACAARAFKPPLCRDGVGEKEAAEGPTMARRTRARLPGERRRVALSPTPRRN